MRSAVVALVAGLLVSVGAAVAQGEPDVVEPAPSPSPPPRGDVPASPPAPGAGQADNQTVAPTDEGEEGSGFGPGESLETSPGAVYGTAILLGTLGVAGALAYAMWRQRRGQRRRP